MLIIIRRSIEAGVVHMQHGLQCIYYVLLLGWMDGWMDVFPFIPSDLIDSTVVSFFFIFH